MPRTAFDDIAATAHLSDEGLDGLLARARRRTTGRRAGRATAVGATAVVFTGVAAAGALSLGGRATPAGPQTGLLDPASIDTVRGTGGGNHLGRCPDLNGVAATPDDAVKHGAYSIRSGVFDCSITSVAGPDLIEATTSIRTTIAEETPTVWLRTTLTNTAEKTLAFDLASPTLEVKVPEDSHWFHETMTAARALKSDETWSEHLGIESWGGSHAPRGGIGQVTTPRLDGAPAPGVAWNLVLQRPQDDGLDISTSRGTVTLAPGESFVFESAFNMLGATDDEKAAREMVGLFEDLDQLSASVYISLQADSTGGARRTLLIDSRVPLSPER